MASQAELLEHFRLLMEGLGHPITPGPGRGDGLTNTAKLQAPSEAEGIPIVGHNPEGIQTACQMIKPYEEYFVEDSSNWQQKAINVGHCAVMAPLVVTGTAPVIRYVNCEAETLDVTRLRVYTSKNGICVFPRPGRWYIQLVQAGSAPAQVGFKILDTADPYNLLLFAVMAGLSINTSLLGISNTTLNDIVVDEAMVALPVRAGLTGRDSSGAANSRNIPIEARDFASPADVISTLIGVLTNSRTAVFSPTSEWSYLGGLPETSAGSSVQAAYTLLMRDSGYLGSLRGGRFRVTSEGTAITVSNGFTATAPRLTIEAGATNEVVVKRIKLSCLVAGTTNLQYRIVLDPDARYSSGGTAVTLGARTNQNGGSAATATFTAHYGAITATATDADEREIEYGTIVNVTGNGVEISFEEGLIIPASGTLLIYLMDAGAAGTICANVEVLDLNIQ